MMKLNRLTLKDIEYEMTWDITNYIPIHPMYFNPFYRQEKFTPLDVTLLDLEIYSDDEDVVEVGIENESVAVNCGELEPPIELDDMSYFDPQVNSLLREASLLDNQLYSILNMQSENNKTYLKYKKDYSYASACLQEAKSDSTYNLIALNNEVKFYDDLKEAKRDELAESLSDIVNQTFNSNYIFKFKPVTTKTTTNYVLISTNRRGSIGMVLGGAVKQTTGVTITIGILRYRNSNFLFLDEAFSSFSPENVRKIKELIEDLYDMQLILIENKDEAKEELYGTDTVHLYRDEFQVAHIASLEDFSGELQKSLAYIQDTLTRWYNPNQEDEVYRIELNPDGTLKSQTLIS